MKTCLLPVCSKILHKNLFDGYCSARHKNDHEKYIKCRLQSCHKLTDNIYCSWQHKEDDDKITRKEIAAFVEKTSEIHEKEDIKLRKCKLITCKKITENIYCCSEHKEGYDKNKEDELKPNVADRFVRPCEVCGKMLTNGYKYCDLPADCKHKAKKETGRLLKRMVRQKTK
jgi:hypothetical protein